MTYRDPTPWLDLTPATHRFEEAMAVYMAHMNRVPENLSDQRRQAETTEKFFPWIQQWPNWQDWRSPEGMSLFTYFLAVDRDLHCLYLAPQFWVAWLDYLKTHGPDFAYTTFPPEHPRPSHWPQGTMTLSPLAALQHRFRGLEATMADMQDRQMDDEEVLSVHFEQMTLESDTLQELHVLFMHHEYPLHPETFRSLYDPTNVPYVSHDQERPAPSYHPRVPPTRPITPRATPLSLEERWLSVIHYGHTDFSSSLFATPVDIDAWFKNPSSSLPPQFGRLNPNAQESSIHRIQKQERRLNDTFREKGLHYTTFSGIYSSRLLQHETEHVWIQPRASTLDQPHSLIQQIYLFLLLGPLREGSPKAHDLFGPAERWETCDSALLIRDAFFLPRWRGTGHRPLDARLYHGPLETRRKRESSPGLDLLEDVRYGLAVKRFSKAKFGNSYVEPPEMSTFFTPPASMIPMDPQAWLEAGRTPEHLNFFLKYHPEKNNRDFIMIFEPFQQQLHTTQEQRRLENFWGAATKSSQPTKHRF